MSSFKSLEMAGAVSAYQHVTIKKSLFSTKVIYTPTESQVKPIVLEYTPTEGERVERLLNMPLDQMVADIAENGKPVDCPNGHSRLELCLSDDRQFCALQLFRFADFRYNPVFDARFYEGKDAEAFTKLL